MVIPSPAYLVKSALFGSAGVFAQTLLETPSGTSGALERLGTAGLLVIAAYFMLRYFMARLAEKDALIQAMNREHDAIVQLLTDRHLTSLREHQLALFSELRDSNDSRTKLSTTLQELTLAVRGRRGDPSTL